MMVLRQKLKEQNESSPSKKLQRSCEGAHSSSQLTFEETRAKKKQDAEDEENLKHAVRRGKYLFVKRGGAVEYADSFTSQSRINSAALSIQGRWRMKKARADLEKKRREECVDLFSHSFSVAGCPLVAVFCLVKEPRYLVKMDGIDEVLNEYNLDIRPSQNLTREEKISKLEKKHKRRQCLEVTVIQKGSCGSSEIVFKQLVTQAELHLMVPKRLKFTAFEFVDLTNAHAVAHMQAWLPHVARRVVVKRGKVGQHEAAFDRDLALRKKLKFERTIWKTCARVGWGPQWRNWWVHFYVQLEVRLDECVCVISATSKSRRHPGVHRLVVSYRQMTAVLGNTSKRNSSKIDWRSLLEEKVEDVEAYFKLLVGKMRLVNTVEGARLVLRGEEWQYQLVQWPEERGQHRVEKNAAVQVQRVLRGRRGRRYANELRDLSEVEFQARARLQKMQLERKRRSSAAVTLQANVKMGFARKRADRLRAVEEDARRHSDLKHQTEVLREEKAVVAESVWRGALGRRKANRKRLENRAAEKERQGLFECDAVVNGTRLYVVGQIQLGLNSVDDMVIKLEGRDERMKRTATLTVGNTVVGKVVSEMEEDFMNESRTKGRGAGAGAALAAPTAVAAVAGGGDGMGALNLRGVFLRVVAKLTLFKSIEKNIFILAFKKEPKLKEMKEEEERKREEKDLDERRKARRASAVPL